MHRVIDDNRLVNIASAIREKTGKTTTYTDEEMPGGVSEVYEAGKTKEWSDFWDVFQDNGNRTSYMRAFSTNWDDTTFKPKYDMIPTDSEAMFIWSKITNFKEILKKYNVILDTSKSERMMNMFQNNYKITELPEISFESVTTDARIVAVFSGDYELTRIDKVIYPTDVYLATTTTFQSCGKLTYLRIGGVLGKNFSVQWCPLDVDSIKSVITHLKDYAGTSSEYAYTVTFKASAFSALEAEEATAEYNGVACTWAELIDNLKWNLVKA